MATLPTETESLEFTIFFLSVRYDLKAVFAGPKQWIFNVFSKMLWWYLSTVEKSLEIQIQTSLYLESPETNRDASPVFPWCLFKPAQSLVVVCQLLLQSRLESEGYKTTPTCHDYDRFEVIIDNGVLNFVQLHQATMFSYFFAICPCLLYISRVLWNMQNKLSNMLRVDSKSVQSEILPGQTSRVNDATLQVEKKWIQSPHFSLCRLKGFHPFESLGYTAQIPQGAG